MSRFTLKLPIVALMVGVALAGCGRKGPLEAPSAAVPTAEAAKVDANPALTPMPKQPKPEMPKQEVPKKPFFLDFIL